MKVCAIIPSYNAENTIVSLINAVREKGLPVIVVDDGSTDHTQQLAQSTGVIVLQHRKNEGKGAALRNGFNYVLTNTDADAVILLDSDGQHEPESIPDFLKEATDNESTGVVVGNRMARTENMPLVRKLTNRFMSWCISKICGQYIPDTQCGFRLVKRPVLEHIKLLTSNFEIESETLIRASRIGYRVSSIPIRSIYSKKISSKINPLRDTLRFVVFIVKELWISIFQKNDS